MSAYNRSGGSKEIGVQSTVQRFEDGTTDTNYNHVEQKYLGTVADQQEMQGLGRVQQLRVCALCFPTCAPSCI